MADYASMKVPELKKLLSERSLAQGGNKADLIKRLQEDDGVKAGPTGGEDKTGEEEITYDEDEGMTKATEQPSAPAPAAQGVPATEAATATGDAVPQGADDASAAVADDAAAVVDDKFTKTGPGLAPSDAKTEAEKRAARAARFGIKQDEETEEARAQKRAERFGLANDQISALDSALPDRPAKRGRERADDGGRDNKRGANQGRNEGRNQGGRNQGRGQGRNNGGGRTRGDRRGGDDKARPSRDSGLDAAEKKKKEERAKRFA